MYGLPKVIEYEVNYRIPKIKKYIIDHDDVINKFRNDIYGIEDQVKKLGNRVLHDMKFRASALKPLKKNYQTMYTTFQKKCNKHKNDSYE